MTRPNSTQQAVEGLERYEPAIEWLGGPLKDTAVMGLDGCGEYVRFSDVLNALQDQNKSAITPITDRGGGDGQRPEAMVRAFHERFGLPVGEQAVLPERGERNLRRNLLAEEYREYLKGEDEDDLVEIADALGDMVCVIYGTALSYGINLEAVLDEIARSNATKTRDPDKEYPSKNIVKGPSFSPPNIAAALAQPQAGEEEVVVSKCGLCGGRGFSPAGVETQSSVAVPCPDCTPDSGEAA